MKKNQNSQPEILNDPLKTARNWKKLLQKPTAAGIKEIINELLAASAILLLVNKMTIKDYASFAKRYNELKICTLKFVDPDTNWSTQEGIDFLKCFCDDVNEISKQLDEYRNFILSLVMYVGCFFWMQFKVKFDKIVETAKKAKMINTSSSSSIDEDDTICDDLPYFNDDKKEDDEDEKEQEYTGRRLVRRGSEGSSSSSQGTGSGRRLVRRGGK